jgi:biotin carboxylase
MRLHTMKVAVVDGHSTGRALVAGLRARGVRCLHVQSAPDLPEFYTRGFRPSDYEELFPAVTEPRALAAALAQRGVERVLAGTEPGVTLADTLTHLMGLPGNEHTTLAARRDKAAMAEAVAGAGLAVPLGRTFTDAADAAAWFGSASLEEAVVKPLNSAGTDNVRFCGTAQEVLQACRAVLNSRNLYGESNRAVLVQERLRGTEYYVNTVSHDGIHRAAEIWRYTKRIGPTGSPVYDHEEPVAGDSEQAAALLAFVPPVLDALGVVSGAAHTEVMVTSRGPVLIESGARLGGATVPWVVEKYSGLSQTSLLIETVLAPERLRDFDDRAVSWSGAVRNVALINHAAGRVRSLAWADRVAALPTAVEVVHGLAPGSELAATTDLINSPGFVYLAADDPRDVDRDHRALRAWEQDALYTS